MPKPLQLNKLIQIVDGEVCLRLSPVQCLVIGQGLNRAAAVESPKAEEWDALALAFYSAGQASSHQGGLTQEKRDDVTNFWRQLVEEMSEE